MKRLISAPAITLVAASMLTSPIFAGPSVSEAKQPRQEIEERTVFVTGSLIPQRIQLRRIGTTTFSPIRIIDRNQIDGTGRHTTAGAFVNEPALRILGR